VPKRHAQAILQFNSQLFVKVSAFDFSVHLYIVPYVIVC